MNVLELFAGVGGGILGSRLLGWRTVCAVEIDPYCREVLLRRQEEGYLPPFPIWDNICTFDGEYWRNEVDIITGGFPCQDISCANAKGEGLEGVESGLWKQFYRVVKQILPPYVLIENVGNIRTRGLAKIRKAMQKIRYRVTDADILASECGAPHHRARTWILCKKRESVCPRCGGDYYECLQGRCGVEYTDRDVASDADSERCEEQSGSRSNATEDSFIKCIDWWCSEPKMGRVVDGVAFRVDRLKAAGNGQVAAMVARAWEILR
jgi:DNA (cytosine-5)-methyltransferase 1